MPEPTDVITFSPTRIQQRQAHQAERNHSKKRRAKVAGIIASLSLLALAGVTATWSAFSGTTTNPGNTFNAGTVELTDNDADAAMFTFDATSPMAPGVAVERCINVTYTGSLDAVVKLYSNGQATPLAQYLDVKVERGTGTNGADMSCTTFTPDATTPGTYTLATFPADYGSGFSSGTPWTTNDVHAYRFTVTLQDVAAAEGLASGPVEFTWEAQNS